MSLKTLSKTSSSKRRQPTMRLPQPEQGPQASLPVRAVQRAAHDPAGVMPQDMMALQRTLGNRAARQLAGRSASAAGRAAPDPAIQRKPIDKDAVIGQLAEEPKGMKALKTLDRVRVYEVDNLKFLGDDAGAYAITFPYEKPPAILLNEPAIDDDAVGAITLYHESKHAFDPNTPSPGDNTPEAMMKDFANEARVLRKEAKQALRMGGKALQDALSTNVVKPSVGGGYEVNEEYINSVGSGTSGYGDYAKVSRSKRFNRSNYTYNTQRDLSWDWTPRPGLVTPFSKLKKGTDVTLPFESLKKGLDTSLSFEEMRNKPVY